jgi:cytochrome c peroxidase
MIRLAFIALLSIACTLSEGESEVGIDLGLPEHFPQPRTPEDNPMTPESVELGRHLFYDTRLSVNDELSCSHCHQQEFAFADSVAVSMGATGEPGVLNAPALTNVIYSQPLTWAHGDITRIEDQLIGPMFGESPLEMGMTGAEAEILERLAAEPAYQRLFSEAFPGRTPDLDLVRYALASFVRSLVSYDAPFDHFLAGDSAAISTSAKRGSELFYSTRLGCSSCHAGFAFTTATRSTAATDAQRTPFHNIGLYNLDADGGYPQSARGLIEETGFERDMGRFRVPSLRNVALTAPYGHDGSVATLEEFIRIYEAGGRHIEEGPLAGDGRDNPWRSDDLKSFELSDQERADLIAFLQSLSDATLIRDPRHANPW